MIYITTDISGGKNPRGEYFTTITFLGQDGREYHTYIVDGYRNEKHWSVFTDNPTAIYAFEHNKLKKGQQRQLDADVKPTNVVLLDKQSARKLLKSFDIDHTQLQETQAIV